MQILLAHAKGDAQLAAYIAEPLQSAGYEVLHYEGILVGDSLVEMASQAISRHCPVVLCGTARAAGSRWVTRLVSAARGHGTRIFTLHIEEDANLDALALDGKVAPYWKDPDGAIGMLLEALSDHCPAENQNLADPRLSQLERSYRERTLEACDIVDLINFPITDRELFTRNLLLRSLYVSLRVSVDISPGTDPYALDTKLQSLEAQREDHHSADTGSSRHSVGARLQESNRLVVLGDPGAGKSTLLRWITTAYLLRLKSDPDWSKLPDVDTLPDTDWLPVYIRCRELDRSGITGSLAEMIHHHLREAQFSTAQADDLTPMLLDALGDGRALLLIDGLDEIADPTLRARFCGTIEKIHIAFPKAPVIVTSRIVGYREMGLRITRGFEHVTVRDLTPEDKDDFARRWCEVTEPPFRRETAAEQLIRDIHSTDRVERLTGNPMLLTTMALVKKKVGKLPNRRADLYREAVDVLLCWRSDVDEPMNTREALPQLQYLAYTMCERGDQQIRQDEVVDILERMRREFPAIHDIRNRPSVEFLRRLERQTGILVEAGHVRHQDSSVPVYEFRHLTFQEYLAGLALVERRYPGRDRTQSLAEQVGVLTAHTSPFHGARGVDDVAVADNWREAIRLSVMTCKDDDVDDVLRAIATPLPEESASLTARPRAALACSCLADEPNVSEEVAAEIIERFIATLTQDDGKGPAVSVADMVLVEVGASVWGALLTRRIVTSFLRQPEEFDRLGGSASMVLSSSIPDGEDAVRRWVKTQVPLLREPQAEVAIEAALALMVAGFNSRLVLVPGLVEGLTSLLERGPCEAMAAAWALGWAQQHRHRSPWKPSPEDVRKFAELITSGDLPPSAVSFLLWCFNEGSANGHTGLAAAVMNHFVSANSGTRRRIAKGYAELFPHAVEPVMAALSRPEPEVRREAALLLSRLQDRHAVAPLLASLADIDGRPDMEVVQALGRLRAREAVKPLLGVLTDRKGAPHSQVVTALGAIGDLRAVEPLLDVLTRSDGEPRVDVVRALGELRDQRAAPRLLPLLVDSEGEPRFPVVHALGRLGDHEAVEPLLGVLTDGGAVQTPVVEALGLLGDRRAVPPLLRLLRDTPNPARHSLTDALGLLRDPQAVKPLLDVLFDENGDPDPYVVRALGRIGDPRALRALSAPREESASDVRLTTLAARAALGDRSALVTLQESMRGPVGSVRQLALWSLALMERDSFDKLLLSRDLDGESPGVDPNDVITDRTLTERAEAVDLTLAEVRARYDELAKRYPLKLAWSAITLPPPPTQP